MDTTGDCIILSRAINTFGFWLVAINLCELPTPTDVNVKTEGTAFNAFSALLASWIVSSSTLTTNRPSSGMKLVVIPVSGKVVNPIPILSVVDNPAELYLTLSPVTKKWSGIVIVSPTNFTIVESLPSNIFSKTGLNTCFIGKDLFTSRSVPVYFVNDVE